MTKTKVLYDARWILVENRHDGISRYAHELAKAMAARDDLDITWLVYDKRQLAKLPERPHLMVNRPENMLKEALVMPHQVNKAGFKLLYNPFFATGVFFKKYKLVLTVHDLIYFKHRTPPQWLAWHIRLGWWLYYATIWPMRTHLNFASIVATVSETARQELIAKKMTKRKIVTVQNAVSDEFLDSTPRDHYNLDNVVYMGAFMAYKNVECLLDALAFLPTITLHLCGKIPPARRPELEQYIAERNIAHRVVLYDGATDDQYRQALRNARCAVSASRIEGFGLPLIEAQQAGVPFVAADTPIFHEIGQDSVLYFNPDSPEECAKQIEKLSDLATSNDYIERGYKNAARYNWNTSAAAAAKICKELA